MILPENITKNEDESENDYNAKDLHRYDSFINKNDHEYWYNPNLIKDITSGVQKKLTCIVVICSLFILIESIGAYVSESIAIFTDVAHLLSDLVGFILSLVSVYLSKKSSNDKFSYGYIRAEVIGALFSVVIIWVLTIWIIIEAINRIANHEYENVNPGIMIVVSIVGLGVNLLMGFSLHDHGHGHNHDHGHNHNHDHGHNHKHDHGHNHKHEDGHCNKDHHKKSKTHGHCHEENHKHSDDNCKNEKEHNHNHLELVSDEKEIHSHSENLTSEQFSENEDFKNKNIIIKNQEQVNLISNNINRNQTDIKIKVSPEFGNVKSQTSLKKDDNQNFSQPLFDSQIKMSNTDQYFGKKTDLEYKNEKKEPLLKKKTTKKKNNEMNLSMVEIKESHNIRAASIHILGDTLQSLGVILVSVLIFFQPTWKILDPILSIVFCVIAVSLSLPVLRDVLILMMDTTPKELDSEQFRIDLAMIRGVTEVHDMHIWLLSHGKPSLTVHLKCSEEPEYVLKKATILCRKVGIFHSTVQVEMERNQTKYPIDCGHNVHN